ncbi:hypothetical protein K438DRAFT_2025559 [Mycena galopus ATCC 62051]|nr:hypothetical protein K438DRAFT_2025559 [Mycena galopus ATCC 62051]
MNIFLCSLPLDGRVRPSPKTAPLLFAQICRQWRTVALATPELWSSIFLDILPHSSYAELAFGRNVPFDPTTALVDLWFRHSPGYPLSITIRCSEPGIRLPHGLVESIKNKVAQWERLEAFLSIADLLELDTVSGPFPCLRVLAIDSNEGYRRPTENVTLSSDLCVHCTSLQGLRIPNSSYLRKHPFPQEPASTRLTTLELSMYDSALVVPVLDRLPHLKNFIFHCRGSGVYPSHPPVPVIAQLRCLILGYGTALLHYVTLPSLEHLGVSISQVEESNAVVAFVVRSGCVLTRLTLLHAVIPLDAWSALLRVADTVPTLQLADTRFGGLRNITICPPAGSLAGVNTLSISTDFLYNQYNFDVYDRFLEMLRARPYLQRARLQIFPKGGRSPLRSPGHTVAAAFRRLAAKGMLITIETPTYRWPENSLTDLDGDYNIFDLKVPLPFHDW